MAALVKKAPALLAAAKELATPKLNTFLRYAKVNVLLEILNINIENLLNRLNWSLLPLQKSLQQLQIFQLRCCIFDEMPNISISSGLVTVGIVRNY